MKNLITQRLKLSDIKMAKGMKEAIFKLLEEHGHKDTKGEGAAGVPFIRKFFVQEKIDTTGTKDEPLGEGEALHYISTAAVDRDKEIMIPAGADLKNYRKNPIVLWGHNYVDPDNIIGKNRWIKTTERGLKALTRFNLRSEKAAKIYGMYKDAFLTAWSVGFISLQGREPKAGESKAASLVRYIHEKWALLEYSAVSVPANPEALTEAVAKGYELGDGLIKDLGLNIKEEMEIGTIGKIGGDTIIDLGALSGQQKEAGEEETPETPGQKDEAPDNQGTGTGDDPQDPPAKGSKDKLGLRTFKCTKCGEERQLSDLVIKEQKATESKLVRWKFYFTDENFRCEKCVIADSDEKIHDPEGNPSTGDIRDAIYAVTREMSTDKVYYWIYQLYPVRYPSGSVAIEKISKKGGQKLYSYKYEYADGKATLGEKTELDVVLKPKCFDCGGLITEFDEPRTPKTGPDVMAGCQECEPELFDPKLQGLPLTEQAIIPKETLDTMQTELLGLKTEVEGMRTELQEKAGAELSAKNRKSLGAIADAMETATTEIKDLLKRTDPNPAPDPDPKTAPIISIEALIEGYEAGDIDLKKVNISAIASELAEKKEIKDVVTGLFDKQKGKV